MSDTPDVVLLDIGTNDVLQQIPIKDRMRNIDRIVTSLRQKNPNVRIMLAQISPTSDTFRNTNSGLDEYNQQLLSDAQRMTSAASPIVVVDMNTAWSTEQFTQADGIHPNTEGEVQLGPALGERAHLDRDNHSRGPDTGPGDRRADSRANDGRADHHTDGAADCRANGSNHRRADPGAGDNLAGRVHDPFGVRL